MLKNNKKEGRLCMKVPQPQYICAEVPQSPISKSKPPSSAAPSLSRTSQTPGQDQQNGKPTVSITTLVLQD